MAAVNEKVEEWKVLLIFFGYFLGIASRILMVFYLPFQKILASKDDELIEYQQMLFNMKEEIKMARLDVDRNSILALQQVQSI